MTKIKTLKAAKKRFKKISTGKYKYRHAYTRHILTKKSRKYKRHLRRKPVLSIIYSPILSKCIPYM